MLYFFWTLLYQNDLSDNFRELAEIWLYITRVKMFIYKNIYYIFHLFAGSTRELLSHIPLRFHALQVLTFYYSWQSRRSQSDVSDLVRRSRLTSDWLTASPPRAQRSVESVGQVHLLRTPSRMRAKEANVKTVISLRVKLSLPSQWHHWLDCKSDLPLGL